MAHKIKEKNQKSVFDKEIGGFSNGLVRECDWFYFNLTFQV